MKICTHLSRIVLALLAVLASAVAQGASPGEAEQLSQKLNEAYVAAFNRGDAAALGALYADDVQYTSDEGTPIEGRAAVVSGLKRFFSGNQGAALAVRVDSARFLTPDVLVEKGLATIGDETTRYVCNYVKKEGAWLITELHETTLPPADAAAVALEELSWMVGSWKDNTEGEGVKARTAWIKNNRFLRRSVTVPREGEETLDATEVIGYDPVRGQVRSWVFDSDGGFGEGLWRREGNKWIVSFRATGPDGTTSTAQHVLTHVSEEKFTWESINRQSEGEVLPNIDKIEVLRTAAE